MKHSPYVAVLLAHVFAVPICSVAQCADIEETEDFRLQLAEIKGLAQELVHKVECLETRLEETELPKGSTTSIEELGLKLEPMARDEFRQVTSRYDKGLKIIDVQPGSFAAEAGLRVGDIMIRLNSRATGTKEEVEDTMSKATTDKLKSVKVYILRGADTHYGYLPIASSPAQSTDNKHDQP